jgi:WD40 repeat protein
VTFTPDGRLAFERGAKAGRVVDAATGATLSTVPIREGQWSDGVAITPDGSRLLTLGAGRVARLWLVPERPGPARVVWRRRRVDEVALSPDGHRFATARKDGFVRVWDTRKAKLLTQLDNYGTISVEFRGDATVVTTDADLMRIWMLARPSRPVWESADALDLSPDGRLLLVGGRGRRIDIRSLARPAKTTASFRGALSDVPAFSPDSRLVVDSAEDGIRLWTVAGEQLGAFGNRAQQVVWSALSHDDGLLLTAGVDGVTRLWRISASPLLHTAAMPGRRLRRNDRPSPEKLVSNGRRTLVGLDDGTIVVWNGRGSDPIVLGSGSSRAPQAITPDGRRAATYDAKTIRVWDTKTGDQLTAIRAPYASSIALDDDGERVASTNGVHSIAVWRTSDGSPLASVYAPYVFREEDTLELHLAGDRLATGSGHLYDLSSKKPIPLRIPKDARTHVAFSPDGTLVAVGTPDDVRLFRTQDGALVRTLTGHQRQVGLDEGVLSVAFSTDGRRLLTTGTDETTRVWTVATGEQDHVLHDPYPRDGDLAPVFSPDGRLFAAPLGGGIAIWSVESGDRLMTVEGAAVPFAFTPDGSGIVTADDRTLRVHGCDACGSLEHLKALARRRLGG